MKLAQPLSAIDAIRDDFAFLDEWEDRYRYVIELGRSLEPLPEAAHNDANKVRGCVSQVWLRDGEARRADDPSLSRRQRFCIACAGSSPSPSRCSPTAPRGNPATDAQAIFRELGLEQHLTPQRSNGVRAMIERIRADAAPA